MFFARQTRVKSTFAGPLLRGLCIQRPYVAAQFKAVRIFASTTSSGADPTINPLSASKIEISTTSHPKTLVPEKDLIFGHTFSDHMLTIDWTNTTGWESPKIVPYGPLVLDPSCIVFHYGLECFEGMKAYKDAHGKIRLFRPDMNMKRMNKSCDRLVLPVCSLFCFTFFSWMRRRLMDKS